MWYYYSIITIFAGVYTFMAKTGVKTAKRQAKPEAKGASREKLHRLKEVLESQGKSQYWLARETGITDVSINSYFHNRVEPSLSNLKKIADALGVAGKDLINF
jgi:putative transcriptional regulator